MSKVAKNIRDRRKELKMSQEELAQKIFTTRQTISNYENGKSNPDIETLEKLAEALDTDLMYLVYGEQKANEKEQKIKKLATTVVVLVLLVLLLLRFIACETAVGCLMLDMLSSEAQVSTEIEQYHDFMGDTAKEEYRYKLGADESIFPEDITDNMTVEDYKMVYYNPWDPQYLSYLVVQYDEDSYAAEMERLGSYPSTEYLGEYGAAGFDEKYQLAAMHVVPDHYGFVYALTDGCGKIIYVEILFCNYFMDIDYTLYIEEEYLPKGFDASADNEYREIYLEELSKKG